METVHTERQIPLLSPKALADFTPEEFYSYVKSLHIEPVKAAPARDFGASVNKKGNLILRVKRKPKFLLATEVRLLAEELGWTIQATWLQVAKKKDVEIRRG